MSHIVRPASLLLSAAALLGALLVPAASAAPVAPRPDQSPGPQPVAGKADSDGDQIANDLEAELARLRPSERVAVIVQGTTPSDAVRAAPSLQVDKRFRIIPAFAGSVNAGQVAALARIPTVTLVELDGISTSFDAAGDRDYGVTATRAATPSLAQDGTLDGDGVGICIIDTGIDPNHEQLSGRVDGWIDYLNGRTTPYDDHGHGTRVAGIAAGDAAEQARGQATTAGWRERRTSSGSRCWTRRAVAATPT